MGGIRRSGGSAAAVSARVLLPTALREYAAGAAEVEVRAETAANALRELAERYPPLRRHLFDDAGALRGFVRVYVNDRDLRELGLETPLSAGDVLLIVPSVAGG